MSRLRIPGVICCLLLLGALRPAGAQAYCNLKGLKVLALSNGVQLQLEADGLLSWRWEPNSQPASWGQEMPEVALRFPEARLTLDKTLYDIDQDPVSNATLVTPQDAKDGRGVVLTVAMTAPSKVQASLSPDRQTFMLTVFGTRTIERPVGAPGAETIKTGEVQVTAHDGLICVGAVKANIHEVVAEIARLSGVSVAVDDAVRRAVSLHLQDRPPLEVIRGIAAGYGLALSSVGDVYMLSEGVPADLTTYQRSGTTAFPMKYVKASDATQLLPTFLFKYLHDNPEQNAVVVTAPSQMLEKIGRDLQAVDLPPPMILVECAVVELSDSADLDKTFRWRYASPGHDIGTDSGTGKIDVRALTPEEGLATAIVPTRQVQLWLQSLLTRGRAKVEAHPSMAAVNGKYAEIFIGSQRFIKMTVVRSGVTQERIETIPVGVRLKVRPWTGGNREITSWVSAEVSNIVEVDPSTGIPRLGTRNATTTMRTVDGDTIVIGGLTQRQSERTRRRIPLLSDLPLLGPLFTSTSSRANTTELVVLLRPRLLDARGCLPCTEDLDLRTRFLTPQDPGYPPPRSLPSGEAPLPE